jgi:translation initiation factor IF-2
MNVSELARKLHVTPNELLEMLPRLGFDIGRRAIKIDNATASRIIREWPALMRRLETMRLQELKKETEKIQATGEKKEIKIPKLITVREFAAMAGLPVNAVIAELIKNGIFASLNEKIDFETAAIVGSDLGFEVKLDEGDSGEREDNSHKITTILGKEHAGAMLVRPPVVVVMGHVDHGKTKLLDAVRRTNVIDTEAGGITQHIGAYQVERKDKKITFIDTPGHEAFTAMRSRGARIADIAILVVAADDGVKPQTVEAYRIIEAAKLPFIVAINKIDKPEADINKTKQELSTQLNITPEDWGGKIVCAPISAKAGTGIEELLDMILLTAEMEAENIKANPDSAAIGTIIESRVSKGEGPVATVLIQNGTLKIGDQLCFGGQIYGKVRALKNYRGENIASAAPATPVKIIGLKIAPLIGDILEVGEGEKIKTKNLKTGLARTELTVSAPAENEAMKKINLIIKADVLGSAEAIEESLEKIGNTEVKAEIIIKGLGNITEGDILRAESAGAKILAFSVKVTPEAAKLARDKNVTIKIYRVIYDLINDVKTDMQALLTPEVKRVDLGKMKVKAIFRSTGKEQIVGGVATTGRLEKDALIEVERDGQIIENGKLLSLQAGKQDVSSVESGQECGIKYLGGILKPEDVLLFYKEESIVKKL